MDKYGQIPSGTPRRTEQKRAAKPEQPSRKRQAKQRAKSRKRKCAAVIVCVLLLLAAGLVFVWKSETVFNWFFSPEKGILNSGEQMVAPTFAGENRREGVYNVLVVGHDRVALNTDVIMIVSFDTQNKKAAIAQIPRDTYMDTVRVNSMYAIGYNEAIQSGADRDKADQGGMENLIDSLQKSFSITIDRYVMMDLDGFSAIVDMVGGVDVDIPYRLQYSDPEQGLNIDLPAGLQHLDGEQAEQFVRFRKGYANQDLGRVNAQKLFLSAFFNKAQESLNVSKATQIAKELIKYVDTSMTVSDMAYFIRYGLELQAENIVTFTMPGCAPSAKYYLFRDDCINLVNSYLNVYTEPVTVENFDVYGFLADTQHNGMYEYYLTPAGQAEVYSLGSVAQEMEIPKG